MGISRNVYLGPYVEFRVPKSQEPFWSDSEALAETSGMSAVFDGDDRILRYIPNTPRDGMSPYRDLDDDGAWPITDGDASREIILMVGAYAAEIAELRETYKVQPDFKWGLLKWSS